MPVNLRVRVTQGHGQCHKVTQYESIAHCHRHTVSQTVLGSVEGGTDSVSESVRVSYRVTDNVSRVSECHNVS